MMMENSWADKGWGRGKRIAGRIEGAPPFSHDASLRESLFLPIPNN